jgi:heme iron utilization protein
VSTAQHNEEIDRAAADARALLGAGMHAALGTIDRHSGAPYASLVAVAIQTELTPVLLLSGLAQHTQNLARDPRASLLFTATSGSVDPLTLPRVTLLGKVTPIVDDANGRGAFLAKHPQAAGYASFGDFGFYRFAVERGHFIGGFGRIVELSRNDMLGH